MIRLNKRDVMPWKSGRVGLRRHPAKVLCGVICTVGSNPTFSEFKNYRTTVVFFILGVGSHPVGLFPSFLKLILNQFEAESFTFSEFKNYRTTVVFFILGVGSHPVGLFPSFLKLILNQFEAESFTFSEFLDPQGSFLVG